SGNSSTWLTLALSSLSLCGHYPLLSVDGTCGELGTHVRQRELKSNYHNFVREHRSLQERRTADQSDGREARETKETRQSFQNKDTQQCQNPGEGRQFVYYMSTS
ncbi:hypothetical protein GBAR_LOCUS15734, partial [Geodia barretti]